MNIWLVTPAPRSSRAGNRASANRWAAILRQLGHRVKVATDYHGEAVDLMVGLHASPLWILLAASDVSRGAQAYLRELGKELKGAGVMEEASYRPEPFFSS